MLAMDEWGGKEVQRRLESWVMRGRVGRDGRMGCDVIKEGVGIYGCRCQLECFEGLSDGTSRHLCLSVTFGGQECS
jgi:hypothetical protein